MDKVKIDIFPDKAILHCNGKVKTIVDCKSEIDSVVKALTAINIPCQVKLNCSHPLLKKLLPEVNKSLHNINELAGNFDKWQVLSLLILMKKLKNISL